MVLDIPLSQQTEARLDDWINVRAPRWSARIRWPLLGLALVGLFAAPHTTAQAIALLVAAMFLLYAPIFCLWNIWLARNRRIMLIPALQNRKVNEADEPVSFRVATAFYWIFLFGFPIAGVLVIAERFF